MIWNFALTYLSLISIAYNSSLDFDFMVLIWSMRPKNLKSEIQWCAKIAANRFIDSNRITEKNLPNQMQQMMTFHFKVQLNTTICNSPVLA